ncbi:RHTO0S02e07800g1_1 [Rhodotorula toruloides]|uniref:RHTO0S02e07800g1_1 n=1 Tax=Rhodotorula toruloides TaxID=5286 RepID=A0A061AQ62_RHOTO|nr:RHTO0S02e07800g1_1 [Rhodotorula toruloides]
MCYVSATLFYGVCIKTHSLQLAARAWPTLKRTLEVIDLLLARKRRGYLRVSNSTGAASIVDLTNEVWELIRLHTRDAIFEQSCRELVGGCHYAASGDDIGPSQTATMRHLQTCDDCYDYLVCDGRLSTFVSQSLPVIEFLLTDFGLRLVGDDSFTHELPNDAPFEFLSHSRAVAILYSGDEGLGEPRIRSCPCANNNGNGQGNEIVEIDPLIFQLPPDANERFEDLFLAFPQLEAVYAPSNERSPPKRSRTRKTARRSRPSGTMRGRTPAQKYRDQWNYEQVLNRKPRWLLWAHGEE